MAGADEKNPVEDAQSAYPKWECKIEGQPKAKDGFTVGETFELSCEGQGLDLKEPLKSQAKKGKEYQLVFLETTEFSKNKVRFLATSYNPGKYQKPLTIIGENGQGFRSNPVQYHVKTILDKSKKPKPFGPAAPLSMDWPAWIPFAALVVVLVVIGWFLIFFKQWTQKKALEKNIRKFESPLGSYHQFSKDVRLLKRGVIFSEKQKWDPKLVEEYLNRLDESFRLYILREYVVPATSWSTTRTYNAVRKKDRRYFYKYKDSLNRALRELDRAKGSMETVDSKDCEQLTQICRKAVDNMWKSQRGRA